MSKANGAPPNRMPPAHRALSAGSSNRSNPSGEKARPLSKAKSSPGGNGRSADEHKRFAEDRPMMPREEPRTRSHTDPAPPPKRELAQNLAPRELAQNRAPPTSAGVDFLNSGRQAHELTSGLGLCKKDSKDPVAPTKTLLPLHTKIVYCLPTVSTLPIIVLLAAYGNSLYELCGADLSLISACIAGARSLDVITDPGMSYITDAFQSKWGRRKPFLATGCWVYSLSLFLLLKPPYGSSGVVGGYFGMMYILYFVTNTYTTIPYDALAPELTEDSDDRSKLFFISGIFDGMGTLTAVGMPSGLDVMVSGSSINDAICKPDGSKDNVDTMCQLGQTCEEFILDSSKPFVLWGRQSASDISWLGSTNLTNLTAVCNEAANIQNYYVDLVEAHADFCICRRDCASACSLANKRTGFALVGAIFGIYFVVTILGVVFHIRERNQGKKKDDVPASDPTALSTMPTAQTLASNATVQSRRSNLVPEPVIKADGEKLNPPIVPLLMTTLFNKAFTVLLPAWACDGMVNAVIAALLTYYIRYVIAPEYQTLEDHGRDCAKGVNGMSGAENFSYYCSTEYVLAGCCGALFFGAALATPLWLLLMNWLGKVNTWLLWSCVMAITNILLVLPGKGDVMLCAFACAANGLPLGAKFLADAILADIIDYDEFLTGSRREATYTMFKSFLPKIMAIPSIAIPISLMNAFGHVPPKNGMIQEQPDSVSFFIKSVGAILTCIVSTLAFILKRRFPLKTPGQVAMVTAGIEIHKEGKQAMDPVSGKMFMYTSFENEELPFVWDLDHFLGSNAIKNLQGNFDDGIKALQRKTTLHLGMVVLLFFLSLTSAIVGVAVLGLMSNAALSFIPTLLIVSIGISVVAIVFCYTRFNAAKRLAIPQTYGFESDRFVLNIAASQTQMTRDELLDKVFKQRSDLESLLAAYPEVENVVTAGVNAIKRASTDVTQRINIKPTGGKWAAAPSTDGEGYPPLPIQVGNKGWAKHSDTE